jgi:prevent-host-death family protein
MKTTTFTELRNNAKRYFDAVEKGETVEIYRHGKPIAVLSPVVRENPKDYGKNVKPLIKFDGVSLSRMIIENRE